MQIFNTLTDWQTFRQKLGSATCLGFIPTMGNLHQGHSSLIQRALIENAHTCVSIFVNPTQFNQAEDFARYPRTLDNDLSILEKLGIDSCLIPKAEEIYADNQTYSVQEHEFSTLMEGAYRPGHFKGVLTVVMKLFNLVRPTNVYFGEKDYQQYLLLKGMIKAFFLDISIHNCPTIREESGLAFSSRNNLLSTQDKVKAGRFAALFLETTDYQDTLDKLAKESIKVEYLTDFNHRRFVVVNIGGVRLIDNKSLKE